MNKVLFYYYYCYCDYYYYYTYSDIIKLFLDARCGQRPVYVGPRGTTVEALEKREAPALTHLLYIK